MRIRTKVSKLKMVGANILDSNSFCIIEILGNDSYRVFVDSEDRLVEYRYTNIKIRMNDYFLILYSNKGNAREIFTRHGSVSLPDSQQKMFRIWADTSVPYEKYETFRRSKAHILLLQTHLEYLLVNQDGKTLPGRFYYQFGGYLHIDYNVHGEGIHGITQANSTGSRNLTLIITDDLDILDIKLGGN